MEGLRKLYSGDFNDMSQEAHPDGSVWITLSKRGEDKIYRFRVRDLYGPNEEVLEYEEVHTGPPEHIRRRMKEAKEHGRPDQPHPEADI